jgi:hypothetical protein
MISVTFDLRPINVASNAVLGIAKGVAGPQAVQNTVAIIGAEMSTKIDPEISRHAQHGSLGHIFEINTSSTIDWQGKITHSSPGNKAYTLTFKTTPSAGGPSGSTSALLNISAKTLKDTGGKVMPIEKKVQDQADRKGIQLKTHTYPNSPSYLETTKSATRVVGSGGYRTTEGSVGSPQRVVIPTRARYALRRSAPWTNPHHNKFNDFLAKYMTAFLVSRKGDLQRSFSPGPRMVTRIIRESDSQFRQPITPVTAPGLHLVDGRRPYRGYRRMSAVESSAQSKIMSQVNAKTAKYFAKHFPQVRT